MSATIDELDELANNFERLKGEVSDHIQAIADAATAAGEADVTASLAPGGLLFRAQKAVSRLNALVAECDGLEAAVVQLEQVWLISQQLRDVVCELERDSRLR